MASREEVIGAQDANPTYPRPPTRAHRHAARSNSRGPCHTHGAAGSGKTTALAQFADLTAPRRLVPRTATDGYGRPRSSSPTSIRVRDGARPRARRGHDRRRDPPSRRGRAPDRGRRPPHAARPAGRGGARRADRRRARSRRPGDQPRPTRLRRQPPAGRRRAARGGRDDLRFRTWEAERLLREVPAPLPPEQVARLARRTEGWAAGLQLFQLAARRSPAEQLRLIDTAVQPPASAARVPGPQRARRLGPRAALVPGRHLRAGGGDAGAGRQAPCP